MEEPPTVASAIVIPVPTEPSHPESISSTGATAAPPLKRRQSDLSETDSKRRRLSTDDAAKPDTNATSPPRDERRKSRQIEERKRGQRLFGALLGTLSQGSSNAAQKRRADIEKRQQAKLKQQDEEDAQRRRERLENLRAIRRKEQVKYEENTMRIRHANMLHFARFLRTKAEPRIYYKPWELTPGQEEEIQYQIDQARATIDDELEDFERRQERAQEEDIRPSEPSAQEPETVESSNVDTDMKTEEAPEPAQADDNHENAHVTISLDETTSTQTRADDSPATSATAFNERVDEGEMRDVVDDEQGETVVEADEDTVIY